MYEYSTQTQRLRMSAEKLNAQEESQLKGNITYCLDEIASSCGKLKHPCVQLA